MSAKVTRLRVLTGQVWEDQHARRRGELVTVVGWTGSGHVVRRHRTGRYEVTGTPRFEGGAGGYVLVEDVGPTEVGQVWAGPAAQDRLLVTAVREGYLLARPDGVPGADEVQLTELLLRTGRRLVDDGLL